MLWALLMRGDPHTQPQHRKPPEPGLSSRALHRDWSGPRTSHLLGGLQGAEGHGVGKHGTATQTCSSDTIRVMGPRSAHEVGCDGVAMGFCS